MLVYFNNFIFNFTYLFTFLTYKVPHRYDDEEPTTDYSRSGQVKIYYLNIYFKINSYFISNCDIKERKIHESGESNDDGGNNAGENVEVCFTRKSRNELVEKIVKLLE